MLRKSPPGEKLTRGLDGELENLITWKKHAFIPKITPGAMKKKKGMKF